MRSQLLLIRQTWITAIMGKLRSKWRWNIAKDLCLTAHNNCVFSLLEFCNNTSKLAGPGISGTPAAQHQLQSVKQRWAHRYNIRWNENNDQELCLQFTLQIHSRHIAIKFLQNVFLQFVPIEQFHLYACIENYPRQCATSIYPHWAKSDKFEGKCGKFSVFCGNNISVSFFQNNRL